MLDIEFMMLRPRIDATVVIYRYSDGAFRAPIKRLIHETLTAQGIPCEEIMPEALTTTFVNLFGYEGARLCDLRERVWAEKADRFRDHAGLHHALMAHEYEVVVVLAPDDSPFFACPVWPELRSTCLLIDEVVVRPGTLVPLLKCLVRISDLKPAYDLVDHPGFVASFDDLFEGGPPDLSAVIAAFESRVLTRTDVVTGRFDAAERRPGGGASLGPLRERVSALLTERDGWAIIELTRALDARRWARACAATFVVRDLVWATARLLSPPADGVQGVEQLRTRDLTVWATALLGWEERLAGSATARRRPEGLAVGADRLGRDVVRRLAVIGTADPIVGLWSALGAPLAAFASGLDGPLANARAQLIRNLHAALCGEILRAAPPWIERLHACIAGAVREADRLAAMGDAR